MAQGKAVIIRTSGEKEVVTFTIGDSYEMIRNAVNGWIECVRLSENEDLWCNENGLAEGLPLNPYATAIYCETFSANNPVVGDVIITGGADEEGETLGLSDELVEKWMAYSTMAIPSAWLMGLLN